MKILKSNDKRGMGEVPSKSEPNAVNTSAPPSESSGASVQPPSNNGGPSVAGVAEAKATIEAARKRGRPAGSGNMAKPAGSAQALNPELQAIAQELYSAENFEDLVTLPGDIGFAFTGHEHWLPSDKTKRVLARSSAAAARLAQFDPRYLAVGIFVSAMISHYGAAAMKTAYIRRQEKIRAMQPAPEPEKKD